MHAIHELGVFERMQSDGLLHVLTSVELWLGQDPLVVRPEESSRLQGRGEQRREDQRVQNCEKEEGI